ncbi:hypothetical protein [Parvibaculum sp.]|uniref:hypothetical protein n=1 Tax=Parvibaculum sp. TaxID=2024848 RepID=UPI00391CCD7D
MCYRKPRSWAVGNREEIESKLYAEQTPCDVSLRRLALSSDVRVKMRFGKRTLRGTFANVADAADAIRDKLLEWGAE